jgi:hypothetical protein
MHFFLAAIRLSSRKRAFWRFGETCDEKGKCDCLGSAQKWMTPGLSMARSRLEMETIALETSVFHTGVCAESILAKRK